MPCLSFTHTHMRMRGYLLLSVVHIFSFLSVVFAFSLDSILRVKKKQKTPPIFTGVIFFYSSFHFFKNFPSLFIPYFTRLFHHFDPLLNNVNTYSSRIGYALKPSQCYKEQTILYQVIPQHTTPRDRSTLPKSHLMISIGELGEFIQKTYCVFPRCFSL